MGENGFSYNVLAVTETGACAKVIQILSEFWATVQMCPEFLPAILSPALHRSLLLGTELIKRSDSEQHSAPRPLASGGPLGATLTVHQEKDQPHGAAKTHTHTHRCWESFVGDFVLPSGRNLTLPWLLYEPAHENRSVSHRF